MKQCKTCKEHKEETEFYLKSNFVKGKNYPHQRLHCKSCVIRQEYKKKVETKYGITYEQVQERIKEQNNACAICKKEFTKIPSVDHCHITGVARGLLCNNCNTGLGMFEDNTEFLSNAINYLNAWLLIVPDKGDPSN